jgi:hypothetical protein
MIERHLAAFACAILQPSVSGARYAAGCIRSRGLGLAAAMLYHKLWTIMLGVTQGLFVKHYIYMSTDCT